MCHRRLLRLLWICNHSILSFLDLKNAFSSVCHQFLFDILRYLNLIISYIVSCYSQLCTYVSTAKWNTTTFHICRGVFQDNPLSPLLFNLAINPLLLSFRSQNIVDTLPSYLSLDYPLMVFLYMFYSQILLQILQLVGIMVFCWMLP